MFTDSNIGALGSNLNDYLSISPTIADPGALFNFDFWNSAIFYISLVLTIIWLLLLLWGWRKDISDLKKEKEKEEEAQKKEKLQEEPDEKLPV